MTSYNKVTDEHAVKAVKKTGNGRRLNGCGSLYVRGGIFWARWQYHGISHSRSTKIRVDMTDKNGRPCGREIALKVLDAFTEPFRHQAEADVLALIGRRIESERKAEEQTRSRRLPLLLKDLGQAFVDSTRRNDISKTNLNYYVAVCGEFAKFADPGIDAATVTERLAAEWAESIWKSGISPHTFNTKISQMRVIWNVLSDRIESKSNPWNGIKKKKNDAAKRNVLTDDQIKAVHEAAGDTYGYDVDTMIYIGYYTGMRISDSSKLKWEDVDFKTGFIRVVTQKTNEPISVPMHQELLDALARHRKRLDELYKTAEEYGWDSYWDSLDGMKKKERDAYRVNRKFTEYVCPRMAERAFCQRTLLNHLMSKTFQRAGIVTSTDEFRGVHKRPIAGFHSFRHGLASRLAAAGVSERIAMQILGHRSSLIHEHYVHQDEEAIKREMKKLA